MKGSIPFHILTVLPVLGLCLSIPSTHGGTPPTLGPIPAQTVTVGTSYVDVTINVADPDTPLSGLTFSASTSNSDVVQGVSFNIGSGSVIMRVGLLPGVVGSVDITVLVHDDTPNPASTTFLLTVASNSPAPQCVPATGLSAWWRAEGDVQDAVGAHHGGAPQGGAGFATDGKVGKAFSFDGADGSYVSVPDSPAWDLGPTFTIEFWVKLNEIKRSMFIHQESEAGPPASGFEFDLQPGGGLVFARNQADGVGHEWSPPPATNTWYHLAVTRKSDGYRVYVNGVQMGDLDPSPDPVTPKTGPLRIGSYAAQSGYGVKGLIDELSIYNRALSELELLAIHNAGGAGKCAPCLNDTFPPVMTCPSNITVNLEAGPCSSPVFFPAPTASDNCAVSSVLCSPPSGTSFPLGVTLVTCTATDTSSNATLCTFNITVNGNCTPACSSNLLVNGSFESPGVPNGYVAVPGGDSTTIPGWVTGEDGVEWFDPILAPSFVNTGLASDGSYMVELAPATGDIGCIFQEFATVPGQKYKVSFAMGTSRERGRDGHAILWPSVYGGTSSTWYTFEMNTRSSTIVWKRFEFYFAATGSSTTLDFRCFDNPATSFVNLDDVRVTDCPDALGSFGGLSYTAQAGILAQVVSNELILSNIGTQETVNVEFDLSGFQSFSPKLGVLDSNSLPESASITMSAFGQVGANDDTLISSLGATRVGNELQISADYSSIGALFCTILIYDGTNLVAQAFDQAGMAARVIGSTAGSQWTPYTADLASARPSSLIELPTRPLIAVPGGQPVAGTRLIIQPQSNRISQPIDPFASPTYTLGWPSWVPWYEVGPYFDPPWPEPGDPAPNQVTIGSLTRFVVAKSPSGPLTITGVQAGKFGFRHEAFGGAQLSASGTSLRVEPPTAYSNQVFGFDIFGSTAQEWGAGTGIDFDATWLKLTPQPDSPDLPLPPLPPLPLGASLQALMHGSVEGSGPDVLGAIQALKTGSNNISITGNFPALGAFGQKMDIFRGSTIVWSGSGTNSASVGYWPDDFGGVIPPPCFGPGCSGPDPEIAFRWTDPILIAVAGGGSVIGDRIRFVALDPNPMPSLKLDFFGLRLGGGLRGLQLIAERTAPAGVSFGGLAHRSIGTASLTAGSNELAVANLGNNPDFGVSIALGNAPFTDLSIRGLDIGSPELSQVRVQSYGALNGIPEQLLGALIAKRLGTNVEFTTDFSSAVPLSGPPQVTVIVYDGDNIVSVSPGTTNIVVRIPSIVQDIWEVRPWHQFRAGAYRTHLRLPDRRIVALSGPATPVFGTRVEIQACWLCGNPSPQPSLRSAPELSRVDIVARGLPTVYVSREKLGLLAQAAEAARLSRLIGVGKEMRVHHLIGGVGDPGGVVFPLPDITSNFGAHWRPADSWSLASTGATIRASAHGVLSGGVEQLLGTTTIKKLAFLKEIFADFSPVSPQSRRVQVLSNNIVVFNTSLSGAMGLVASVSDLPIGSGMTTIGTNGPQLCFWLHFWPKPQFLINNQAVVGDEIRILAEDPPVVGHLTQFSIHAAGIPELQLTSAVAEQPGPIMTKVQRFGGSLAISWDRPNLRQTLQCADDITGPWTPIPGATTSPYVTTASGARKFYRVIQQ